MRSSRARSENAAFVGGVFCLADGNDLAAGAEREYVDLVVRSCAAIGHYGAANDRYSPKPEVRWVQQRRLASEPFEMWPE